MYTNTFSIITLKRTFFVLLFVCQSLNIFATDYYLDPSGNDNNNGTSTLSPWQTLDKINNTVFVPGDRILLKAGGVWNGQLWPKGSGSPSSSIIIDLYGTGNKPIINGQGTTYPSTLITGAVMLYNQSYWEINNIEVTNYNENIINARAGILILSVSSTIQNHIYIKNCEVHDVNANPSAVLSNTNNKNSGGIIFFGSSIDKDGNYVNVNSGFNDVLVEGCKVYNVTKEGIRNKSDNNGAFPRVNSNIVFRNNHVENVFGDGIVLGEITKGGLIERNFVKNVAYSNSANYAGIWTHYSTGSIIQFNEVCDMVGGSNDGEAFDADNNCDGDIFQYNYSHNNVGGFFLMMPSAKNIIIRYNISKNDGNGKELFHYTNNANPTNLIYNNTFFLGNGITTTLFKDGNSTRTVKFFNNIIKAEGTITKFADNPFSESSYFANNCFFPASIANINGPKNHPGLISQDPLLVDPNTDTYGLDNVDGFKLKPTSTLINAGINIANNGNRDYLNTALYVSDRADIGAIEYPIIAQTPPLPDLGGLTPVADTYVRNGTYSSTNFGSLPTISVKNDATSYEREAYLKFDLNNLTETPKAGKLKLYIDAGDDDVATNVWKIYFLSNDSWTETDLNWNNKPTTGFTELATINGTTAGNYITFDIFNQLLTEYNGDKILSLKIVSTTIGSKTNVEFASRENPISYLSPILVTKEDAIAKAPNIVFWQPFNSTTSNTVSDYLKNSGTGTIAQDSRFTTLPKADVTAGSDPCYVITTDGFGIKHTGTIDHKISPYIKALGLPNNGNGANELIFMQFDMKLNNVTTGLTNATPIFLQLGNYTAFNGSADPNETGTSNDTQPYIVMGIKLPTGANLGKFNFSNSNISTTNYDASISYPITWVINKSTSSKTYTGPNGIPGTSVNAGSSDIWIKIGGTYSKVGTIAKNTNATGASQNITDLRIRTAGVWSGEFFIKNLAIGYIPNDGTGQVLPVEITSFTAKANANSVNLKWTTASENNASHFNITRSINGGTFNKIGKVNALGKAAQYSFTDFSPSKGINYYQLLQEDFDGKTMKSDIVSAKVATSDFVLSVLNSTGEKVNLAVFSPTSSIGNLVITDINGKKLLAQPVSLVQGNNSFSIPVKGSGVLVATITSTAGSFSKKFTKL